MDTCLSGRGPEAYARANETGAHRSVWLPAPAVLHHTALYTVLLNAVLYYTTGGSIHALPLLLLRKLPQLILNTELREVEEG